MSLSDRLNETLQRRGLTQADLARELGVSAPTVSAWCGGKKNPTTANLMQIAAFLGVTPGYLQFGDVSRPGDDPDPALDAERAAYERDLGWYWRPAPRDHGREYGNAAGYAFEPDIETLGREAGQNISDAKLETEPTVDARFTVIELTGERLGQFLNRIKFDEVREHLEASRASNQKAGSVIQRGLEQLQDGRLAFIRIEDFGATGLTGPEFQTGYFMAVARNLLDSQKRESSGGSFGLGKATLWSSSQFGLVLINSNLSVAHEGRTEGRFIGRIDLPWHEMGEREWAGPGWFGQEDSTDAEPPPRRTVSYWGNRALASDLLLDRPSGVPGTSFLIVAAYDASGALERIEEMAEEFAESLADNFWPAMVDRPGEIPPRLRVIVRAERDGQRLFETYVNPATHQPARVATFLRHLDDNVSDTLDEPGEVVRRDVVLRVPRRTTDPVHGPTEHVATLLIAHADPTYDDGRPETAPGTISFLRGNHMVIQAPRVGALPVGARPFHAIVLAGEASGNTAADKAADRFLRASEPPSHNRWIGTPDITANYVRGGKSALEVFEAEAKRIVRDVIRQPSRDLSDGPEALKELLRIVPPTPEGKRPRVKSVRDHSIDDEGAWIIGEAVLSLPPRRDGKGWIVKPILRFGTESGAPIPVKWASIAPVTHCDLGDDSSLSIPAGVRSASFSARTDPASHPVAARRSTVLIDVRADAGGSPQ